MNQPVVYTLTDTDGLVAFIPVLVVTVLFVSGVYVLRFRLRWRLAELYVPDHIKMPLVRCL